jgi:hypothetical protein
MNLDNAMVYHTDNFTATCVPGDGFQKLVQFKSDKLNWTHRNLKEMKDEKQNGKKGRGGKKAGRVAKYWS